MKKIVALLLMMMAYSPLIHAFDAVGKIKQVRPEKINTSRSILSSSTMVKASYQIQKKHVPLNEIHQWLLTLTKIDNVPIVGLEIGVFPDMPEHLHGMATKPQVTAGDKPGEYIIEGMNFHMPGWWVVTLDISKGGMRDLIRFNVLVGEGMDKKMKMKHH